MARYWEDVKNIYKRVSKRDIYSIVSAAFVLFLFGAVINDIVHYAGTERSGKTSQSFTTAVLAVHGAGLYTGLLGFVYNSISGVQGFKKNASFCVVVCHILVFVVRFGIELGWTNYRPEMFRIFANSG